VLQPHNQQIKVMRVPKGGFKWTEAMTVASHFAHVLRCVLGAGEGEVHLGA
jgi:hypothetical protein